MKKIKLGTMQTLLIINNTRTRQPFFTIDDKQLFSITNNSSVSCLISVIFLFTTPRNSNLLQFRSPPKPEVLFTSGLTLGSI